MKPVAVVPVYNHPSTVGALVQALRRMGLPCILVDDGSGAECAAVLRRIAQVEESGVTLVRLDTNQGKGAAVMAGLRKAFALGHTHALQIDADGQHDVADVPRFLAAGADAPGSVICGCPVYDASVPKGRLYARYLTHVWVWINTLSFEIRDSMCGFRLYPLDATCALLASARIGRRMDFDTDVMVRLHWAGVPVVNMPTAVHYPADGISHFRLLPDNVLISAMHTRHFFGMLLRAPRLLWRKVTA